MVMRYISLPAFYRAFGTCCRQRSYIHFGHCSRGYNGVYQVRSLGAVIKRLFSILWDVVLIQANYEACLSESVLLGHSVFIFFVCCCVCSFKVASPCGFSRLAGLWLYLVVESVDFAVLVIYDRLSLVVL